MWRDKKGLNQSKVPTSFEVAVRSDFSVAHFFEQLSFIYIYIYAVQRNVLLRRRPLVINYKLLFYSIYTQLYGLDLFRLYIFYSSFSVSLECKYSSVSVSAVI